MQTYKITIEIDGEERTERWYGYNENVAIAQAFLHHAHQGVRSLKVIDITGGNAKYCARCGNVEMQYSKDCIGCKSSLTHTI